MQRITLLFLSLIIIPFSLWIFVACDSSAHSGTQNNVKGKDTMKPANDSIYVSKELLLGKFSPSSDTGFIAIGLKYASANGFYLNKKAYQAFVEMWNAATKDGISLKIVSATRTFEQQKKIWEGKFSGSTLYYGKNLAQVYPDINERAKYILKYSSMPGTSRHHWGTDVDINSVQKNYFESGTGKKTYEWLKANALKYGFCQPYTTMDSLRPVGYSEEKWHWSYMPLSALYLKAYNKTITANDINGFKGFETAKTLDILKNYVNSINPSCK
jgi:zinc D-Ala-D-Ala carboxypeptidase